jgi:glycosyltransferase involved in cell wall biosynthesis
MTAQSWCSERPAIFASSFYPHVGGVEEVVRQLTRHQAADGLSPVVHTMRWPRPLPARERWSGIEIRRHSYRVPEGSIRRIAPAVVANPVVLATIVRQLRADRADLVHVQCVSHGAWFAYEAARILRLPLVVTIHGELSMDATDVYGRSALLNRTLRVLLDRADVVTACSASTLREVEDWANINLGNRGRVVHNGVDNAEFSNGHAKPDYVLGVGRMVHQKGFDILIDAFASLADDPAFDCDLVLAGDGPERASLQARAAQLGIAPRVRFTGEVHRARVVSLFRSAAVFVLPSRHEPFGLVNLEAMAAGVPVVATNVGGVREIVDPGVNGMLVPPGDPVSLASAIGSIRSDANLRSTLVARGHEQALRFDWSRLSVRYQAAYCDARTRHAPTKWGTCNLNTRTADLRP